MERALRGLLATFDAQSAVTNIESLGLSVDGRSAAVNHLLGELSWPEAVPEPRLRPDATSAERRQVKAPLRQTAEELDATDRQGGSWGVSYRSINVSPATTRALLAGVKGEDVPADELDTQTHVLVHEVAHRVTEPPVGDGDFHSPEPSKAQRERMSQMQLLSEGSADLITHMPGVKHEARARMGLAQAQELPFGSGYDMFMNSLASILRQAGLDSRSRAHREQVTELLERGDMETVPDQLASLIVQKQGIEWRHRDEVADAIRKIGSHGIMMTDEETYAAARTEVERRTAAAEDFIGELAMAARSRRERE